jgi:hypothetical protein
MCAVRRPASPELRRVCRGFCRRTRTRVLSFEGCADHIRRDGCQVPVRRRRKPILMGKKISSYARYDARSIELKIFSRESTTDDDAIGFGAP